MSVKDMMLGLLHEPVSLANPKHWPPNSVTVKTAEIIQSSAAMKGKNVEVVEGVSEWHVYS